MKLLSKNKMFGGEHRRYQHESTTTGCPMTFAVFLPEKALHGENVPALYFLSGLTCTDENFSTKAGAQEHAAKYGLALVMPDTSPRGDDVPNDEAYDLGQGAGFYLNAVQVPWNAHYQMYDYIIEELPALIERELPVTDKRSIFGHSMGGHGALQIALKNPARYAAVSAFAPIVNPSETPWGQKAFSAYLGDDKTLWAQYDSTQLVKNLEKPAGLAIRIDQGTADDFYPKELQPETFAAAAKARGIDVDLRLHKGYDHSYFFIATFVGEHIAFHAKALGLA